MKNMFARAARAGLSFLLIKRNRTSVLIPQETTILGNIVFPIAFLKFYAKAKVMKIVLSYGLAMAQQQRFTLTQNLKVWRLNLSCLKF